MPEQAAFDIAILGAGLTGALLGAVLAKGGARVVLLDDDVATGSHGTGAEFGGQRQVPTGVTTLPQSSFHFELIAARYGVPEIAMLADAGRLRREVSAMCGEQSTLGFVHHQVGREHDGWAIHQFNVPGEHGESHLYRGDVDEWLLEVALSYGCQVRRALVTGVDLTEDGVLIGLSGGAVLAAGCVVDTSGPRSPVAEVLGSTALSLAEDGSARVVSAVLTRVRPFEEVLAPLAHSRPWSAGTLHHLFDGGALWVAPFRTGGRGGRSGWTAPTAVGLCLDERRQPAVFADPEKQLFATADRFPSVARQLERARVVSISETAASRWLASRRTADRVVLLDAAAFGADPLLCRDLATTAELVYTLAGDLLEAVRDGDFAASRFSYLDRLQGAMATSHARTSAAALAATADFALWNGFLRVWLLGTMFAALSLKKNLKLIDAGELERAFAGLRQPPETGCSFEVLPEYAALLDSTRTACELAGAGEMTTARAAERVFGALNAARCVPPIYGFGDPVDREYVLSLRRRLRTLGWLRGSAPDGVRELLGAYGLRGNARVKTQG